MADTADSDLKTIPLHDWHVARGAKMVGFAGYAMPVQYPTGILAEHTWTRTHAGLFDVSHMGQVHIAGNGLAAIEAMEALVPGDIAALKPGRTRYSMFTNDAGGILDDLMITRGFAGQENDLFVVVNAGCKDQDIAHMRAGFAQHPGVSLTVLADRALLALQGPEAAAVLARLAPAFASGASALVFLSGAELTVAGIPCFVTRSGYTGEDGFEISVPATRAAELADALCADAAVKPIGLGARDSLRLEAGLCLYGHDIDTGTTPVEADLAWSISKRRRTEGGFPGAAVIQRQLADGAPRRRVGILPEGKAPAREGTRICADAALSQTIGTVTSGGFGPTVGGPVAMGYVAAGHAAADTPLFLDVRGVARPARVVALPFTPHRYFRG